jgi:hypothetical protein
MFGRIRADQVTRLRIERAKLFATQWLGKFSHHLLISILLVTSCRPAFAQAVPFVNPGPLPTDVTPIRIQQTKELFQPGPTLYMFQKLPSRLWFNLNTEINQRYESNVYLTQHGHSSDYVFRTYPNVTVGYNMFGNTSIYSNYFVIKDLYANSNHHNLTGPTTQSVSMGLRNTKQIGHRNTLQLDFQARELWQQAGLHQADLIPGALITRVLTPHSVIFLNFQLQMRGRNYFVCPTRELDPFYTIGVVYNKGMWQFSAVDTYITNFRDPPFTGSIPQHGNVAMIADFEIARQISRKLPNVVAFLRAEPIFNWHSGGTPGISGFDFRLYSGIRFTLVKPSYASTMNQLKKELQTSSALPNTPGQISSAPNDPASGSTPNQSTRISDPNAGGSASANQPASTPDLSTAPTVPPDLLPLHSPLSPGGL